MKESLYDRTLMILLCSFLYSTLFGLNATTAVGVLMATILACLSVVLEKQIFALIHYILYTTLCIFFPPLAMFLPVLAYDLWATIYRYWIFLMVLPILSAWNLNHLANYLLLFMATGLSILLEQRTSAYNKLKKEFQYMRDENQEKKILLESKNKILMEKQDYEVHTATLRERNRIAREIHDNVGHMLSRSILQVGALMAINKNEAEREILTGLKETLDTAMSNIRESVHDLHDDSIDLYAQIQNLVDNFTFCEVDFQYDIHSTLSRKAKYSILAIVKEALSNTMKHSNATRIHIIFIEHPRLYQLLIVDNGTPKERFDSTGIGLQNIRDRAEGMNAMINISNEKGFRIFLSIPKEK